MVESSVHIDTVGEGRYRVSRAIRSISSVVILSQARPACVLVKLFVTGAALFTLMSDKKILYDIC